MDNKRTPETPKKRKASIWCFDVTKTEVNKVKAHLALGGNPVNDDAVLLFLCQRFWEENK